MWKLSNFSSGYNLWPPDVEQQQKSNSLLCPANANPCGCFVGSVTCPFPGFGTQGGPGHLDSSFIPSSNPQALNPKDCTSGPGENGSPTRRLLVFDQSRDQSRDQTSLIFSSVANLYQAPTPNLHAGNETYAYPSNRHGGEELEEMHEDTEEIDALLYSESEYADEPEEASTGHSPWVTEGQEDVASSHIPAKRRKLDLSDHDESLVDTASSARAAAYHCSIPDDGDAEVSYVGNSINEVEGKPESNSKRERIQMTVSMLRKIIPGGEGKDAAAVLAEAIRYLKSLKLQAKEALGAATTSSTFP